MTNCYQLKMISPNEVTDSDISIEEGEAEMSVCKAIEDMKKEAAEKAAKEATEKATKKAEKKAAKEVVKSKMDIAKNLLKLSHVSVEEIAEATGLSLDVIKGLAEPSAQ